MGSRELAIVVVAAVGVASLASGSAVAGTGAVAASPGNCGAGGIYRDGTRHFQAFVVSQVSGTWHTAIEVPGTAALNQGGDASITSVSCASAGNCSAGGFYGDGFGRQAFVVGQTHGTWHAAIEVPGTAALNQGLAAEINSVSCASAGNCSAGGFYEDSSGEHAFVVSQINGTWQKAIEVPGAALNQGGLADITSVSCASAGNCGAGGFYLDSSFKEQAFVVSQAGGTWHPAIEVPGTAALNRGGSARTVSVSCASAGNCGAGGSYTDGSGHAQASVVSQVNGTWHPAIEVPGTAALNQGGSAEVSSMSCALAGRCSAGGRYTNIFGRVQAFVDSET